MEYNINPLSSLTKVKSSYQDLLSSEMIRGNIQLTFRFQGTGTDYTAEDCNIPLFLSQLSLFITEVEELDIATWYMQIAPFTTGKVVKNNLLLSHASGSNFMNRIFDRMPLVEVDALKKIVARDILKYGHLLRSK